MMGRSCWEVEKNSCYVVPLITHKNCENIYSSMLTTSGIFVLESRIDPEFITFDRQSRKFDRQGCSWVRIKEALLHRQRKTNEADLTRRFYSCWSSSVLSQTSRGVSSSPRFKLSVLLRQTDVLHWVTMCFFRASAFLLSHRRVGRGTYSQGEQSSQYRTWGQMEGERHRS